ncbi:MAG: hypothetical protein HOO96_09635 [Polyangiaceae bacterium]|nr:hypothetical protein [Polyangiaceae bacterium]
MRNPLIALVLGVSVAVSALTGCAADTTADADAVSTDAELRSIQRQVVGSYASGLGHIELNADGTYVGGYAQSRDEYQETLVSAPEERGYFYVYRPATTATQGTGVGLQASTKAAKLVLLPAGNATRKVHDLAVLKGGDIQVSRDGVTQIWVRQILRP